MGDRDVPRTVGSNSPRETAEKPQIPGVNCPDTNLICALVGACGCGGEIVVCLPLQGNQATTTTNTTTTTTTIEVYAVRSPCPDC